MTDIKEVAGTLQKNTAEQGVQLQQADKNIEEVKTNVEEAH